MLYLLAPAICTSYTPIRICGMYLGDHSVCVHPYAWPCWGATATVAAVHATVAPHRGPPLPLPPPPAPASPPPDRPSGARPIMPVARAQGYPECPV